MLQLPLRRERKLEVSGHEAPASNLYSASDHPLTWWIYAETHCDAAWRRPHIVRLRRQRTQSQRYKWHGVEIRFEYGAMVIWVDRLLFVATFIYFCEWNFGIVIVAYVKPTIQRLWNLPVCLPDGIYMLSSWPFVW